MKKLFLYSLALFFCPTVPAEKTSSAAQEPPLRMGQLPDEKNPELLQSKERNPFVRREAKIAEVDTNRETEESKLRDLLGVMSITGAILGNGTVKLLLGNLILKQGQLLPPLIEGQTEHLIVNKITDKQVEIDFVESEKQIEPRKIIIPIDLQPRVTVRLPFQEVTMKTNKTSEISKNKPKK